MWEIEEEEDEEAAAWPPLSLLATWTMTLPVRIPLKMAMASECDRPDVECPFTERISSPAEREEGFQINTVNTKRHDSPFGSVVKGRQLISYPEARRAGWPLPTHAVSGMREVCDFTIVLLDC